MPSVALSMRHDLIDGRDETRAAIDERLIEFFHHSGFDCVLVHNLFKDRQTLFDFLNRNLIDGIVLTGGNDIGNIPRRDDTERWLISYAIDNNVPLLGICRGMQMIGNYFGCALKKVDGHVNVLHKLIGSRHGERSVNSYHNYSLDSCPDQFGVIHRSLDGEIESIVGRCGAIIGIMWHPEREFPFSEADRNLVRNLFSRKVEG